MNPGDYASLKERVYPALNPIGTTHAPGLLLAKVFALIIMINVVAAVLETATVWYSLYGTTFDLIAYLPMIVFSIEYALRLRTCTCDPAYRHPLRGRLRYAASPRSTFSRSQSPTRRSRCSSGSSSPAII